MFYLLAQETFFCFVSLLFDKILLTLHGNRNIAINFYANEIFEATSRVLLPDDGDNPPGFLQRK